jgi:hypothetical protein
LEPGPPVGDGAGYAQIRRERACGHHCRHGELEARFTDARYSYSGCCIAAAKREGVDDVQIIYLTGANTGTSGYNNNTSGYNSTPGTTANTGTSGYNSNTGTYNNGTGVNSNTGTGYNNNTGTYNNGTGTANTGMANRSIPNTDAGWLGMLLSGGFLSGVGLYMGRARKALRR